MSIYFQCDFRYNDPTVCMKGSISALYSPCNDNNTMSGSLNNKCSSPSAVRAATLPRNVYHSSANQLSLHNDEGVTSFSNNHTLNHHYNAPQLHAVSEQRLCYDVCFYSVVDIYLILYARCGLKGIQCWWERCENFAEIIEKCFHIFYRIFRRLKMKIIHSTGIELFLFVNSNFFWYNFCGS